MVADFVVTLIFEIKVIIVTAFNQVNMVSAEYAVDTAENLLLYCSKVC